MCVCVCVCVRREVERRDERRKNQRSFPFLLAWHLTLLERDDCCLVFQQALVVANNLSIYRRDKSLETCSCNLPCSVCKACSHCFALLLRQSSPSLSLSLTTRTDRQSKQQSKRTMRQLIHTLLVGVIGVLSLVDNFGVVVHAFAPTTTRRYQQQTCNGKLTRWNLALHTSASSSQQPNNNNNKIIPHAKQRQQQQQLPLVRSRLPHQLSNGRGTFLGFRNTKDIAGAGGPLKSSVEALMPDGGLSPCVIRVLGVGGGGCNAVRAACVYVCVFVSTRRRAMTYVVVFG